ncbi:MAG: MBL fold metallo-hydrolase [Spirochaetes bacterium]|nr:MBL fold metallo-hydrolase [Spirochaetota bacterium]
MMNTFTLTCLDTPNTNRGVGLALVLETPGRKVWLYDTGCGYPAPNGWEGDFNAGRDIIAPYLKEKGITRLDGVVTSHAHYDHFGGLLWLVDNVPIDMLVDSGFDFSGACDANYSKELSDYTALRKRFQQKKNAYRAVVAGDMFAIDDALAIEVIAPPKGFFPDPHPEKRPPNDPASHYLLNSNSIILKIKHGDVSFLLGGDIEKEDQVDLLLPSVKPGALKCDVLVAPGHGLHSAPEFAEASQPATTVVSLYSRWLNNCTAREAFSAVGSKVYITGMNGRISVVSDGRSHAVTTERAS